MILFGSMPNLAIGAMDDAVDIFVRKERNIKTKAERQPEPVSSGIT